MYRNIPYNFLALPEELSSYDSARVAVLPIPYDLTLSYGAGSRNGPQAIINASRQLETYDDDSGRDVTEIGIATLPEMEQVTASPEAMNEVIRVACVELCRAGKFVLTLGGEHSITAGLVKAHAKIHENLSVIQIDAHSDLRDNYQGSKYSHACVMSRVSELAPFIGIGVRSFSGSENEKKHASNFIRPKDLRKNANIYEKQLANLSENVYITIDLDGLDPSIMPSVGTPEPGGLTWDEVMRIVEITGENKRIVGADIVELSPRPGLEFADFTAAKLAYKVIAAAFKKELA